MTIRVLAVGNLNTDQADHRSLITSLTQSATSVAHRPGFLPTNLVAGLSNVSAMVAGVGAFKAIVDNPGGAGQYLVQSDAVENVTFAAGEASVARIDRIIVRVYNHAQDGSGRDEAVVEYLKGQNTGSPTTLPSGSLLIWEVSVPAGASAGSGGINFTSTAVDKRVYTTSSGGIIPVANGTELDAIQNPWEGMTAYVKDLDLLYIHDGSAWRTKGQASVSSSTALSGIKNPVAGLVAVARDTGIPYVYHSGAWKTIGFPGISEAWTSWTPTWTASTTNPTVGNGQLVGERLLIGKTCTFNISLTMGSTTTYGSGYYIFSIPFAAKAGFDQVAVSHIRDATAAVEIACTGRISGTGIARLHTGDGRQVTNTIFPWAQNDVILISGTYQIA